MLRLESCVEGKGAETLKGLRNSEAAGEATRARLNRKYGGNKRQIQRLTGIDRGHHRRVLHQKKSSPDVMKESSDVPHVDKNESSMYEKLKEHERRGNSLHTFPVILKHEAKR